MVVFLPLFVLPGVMGKFLSNIPITIFITLIAALAISLTINPAVYYLVTKRKKTYHTDIDEQFLSEEEKVVLAHEREGKEPSSDNHHNRRHQRFIRVGRRYQTMMKRILSRSIRHKRAIFFTPLLLLVGSFFL